MRMNRVLVAFVGLIAASVWAASNGAIGTGEEPTVDHWSVIRCGRLIAVPGEPPIRNATVVTHNGRIMSVDRGGAQGRPAGATADSVVDQIDLSDKWVMPGLIDCHVHITSQFSKDIRMRMVTDTDADATINAVIYARRTINAGFTTVRDVGSMGDACFALRDAINAGKIVGPRILASGRAITPTGGHADRTHGYARGIFEMPDAFVGVADGVAECRKAVRYQVKRGADVIKLTSTGGVLSNTAAGTEQQFFDDELSAIIDTAHLLGRKVASHAHGTTGIKAALRAGVDSIEHGTYLDDEAISLFKQTGAYLVPTITAGKAVEQYAHIPGFYPPPVVKKALEVGPTIQGAFAKAYKAGVKIAFGTDAGVYPHGENWREFGYMVEAGMPLEEALIAATVSAADLCNMSEEIGTIEVGKAADMIATSGDPRANVDELREIDVVVKGGIKVKGE